MLSGAASQSEMRANYPDWPPLPFTIIPCRREYGASEPESANRRSFDRENRCDVASIGLTQTAPRSLHPRCAASLLPFYGDAQVTSPPVTNLSLEGADLSRMLELEWLVTNGMGGYASSTVAGANTRRYHGLLTAATRPPAGRRVLLAGMVEGAARRGRSSGPVTAEYEDGTLDPQGWRFISGVKLVGTRRLSASRLAIRGGEDGLEGARSKPDVDSIYAVKRSRKR